VIIRFGVFWVVVQKVTHGSGVPSRLTCRLTASYRHLRIREGVKEIG